MHPELVILCATSALIAFTHTALGPDHYIPFIAMAKSGKWSRTKTIAITLVCGLGHVLSSVVLGFVGIAAGTAISKLEGAEALRGDLAVWLLISFGFAYFVYGVHRAIRHRPHSHLHVHADGTVHSHSHSHEGEHAHVHSLESRSVTPWVLFVVFVLGPCEPLIPILMAPAWTFGLASVALVAAIFALVTLMTMTSIVVFALWGLSFLKLQRFERYTHALAGASICGSGVAVLMGL